MMERENYHSDPKILRTPEEYVVAGSVLPTVVSTLVLSYLIVDSQARIDNPDLAANTARIWFGSIGVGGLASVIGLYKAYRKLGG